MTYNAGVQLDANGFIVTTTNPPTSFVNGLGTARVGSEDALCVDAVGAIASYSGGLPYTATGALAITIVTPPVLRAFSSGFSNGYQ
jgi:hypothetical protein